MINLTFNIEQKANTALTQINTNIGYAKVSINAKTGLPMPGKQQTTSWAKVGRAHDQDLWFIPKPSEKHIEKVVDYKEQEFSSEWLKPTEVI